jgi:hypothetical protein
MTPVHGIIGCVKISATKLTFGPLEPMDISEFLNELRINFFSCVGVFENFLARCDVSLFDAGALTVCFTLSFAVFSAGLEEDADALEAAADLSGISDFLRQVSPCLGIALASIGLTGLAMWEEDSLSEDEILICFLPVTSRLLFSFRVSVRTSFLMPSLKRTAIV